MDAIRRLLLAVVSFSMPLSAFTLLDVGYKMTPFKLAAGALILVCVLQAALTGWRARQDSKAVWVASFFVMFCLSVVVSVLKGLPAGFLLIKASTIISLILYYFVVNYATRTREDLRLVLWSFVLGSAVTALPAALGIESADTVVTAGERFRGLSGQVNILGFDMMMAVPIALGLFLSVRAGPQRLVLAFASLMIVMGMLLSLSRTALVSAAAMWMLGMYRFRRIDSLRYLLPALALGVGVVALAPESVTQRVMSITDPAERARDQSVQSRLQQFEYSLRAFASNPVIGVGFLGFTHWLSTQRSQPGMPDEQHVIHNAYLRLAAEQGAIGLGLYLAILGGAWMQLTRTWRAARLRRRLRDPVLTELGHLAMFLQFSLFGSIVAGAFTHAQRFKTAWMVIALATVVHGLARERLEELESQPAADEPEPALHPALSAYSQRL
jgi:O-antigen ligase